MKKIKNQKGFISIIIPIAVLALVALIVISGYFLVRRISNKNLTTQINQTIPTATMSSETQSSYNQGAKEVQAIQSSNDLSKTGADLDATDTTQLDTQLNQLNSESNF